MTLFWWACIVLWFALVCSEKMFYSNITWHGYTYCTQTVDLCLTPVLSVAEYLVLCVLFCWSLFVLFPLAVVLSNLFRSLACGYTFDIIKPFFLYIAQPPIKIWSIIDLIHQKSHIFLHYMCTWVHSVRYW